MCETDRPASSTPAARSLRAPALALGLWAALGSGWTAPPALADAWRGGELAVVVGETGSDQDITNDESNDLSLGLSGGAVFTPHWSCQMDILYSSVSTKTGLGDASIFSDRVAAAFNPFPFRRLSGFLTAGVGWMKVDYDDSGAQGFDRLFVSGGVGARFEIADARSLRFELRADKTVGDDGLGGADVMQGHALASFVWGPGTRNALSRTRRTKAAPAPPSSPRPSAEPRQAAPAPAPAPPKAAPAPSQAEPPSVAPPSPAPSAAQKAPDDEDQDGVKNRRDQCPHTPSGALVDLEGCPRDRDFDRVPDGIDGCPNTPKNDPVDAHGCPADDDGDRVPNSSDSCAATPIGAIVDEWGCPRDSDSDGVPNGLDRCPSTLAGAVTDKSGCPSDTDGDGVYDGIDRCPDTPHGTGVDSRGCPR